MFSPIFKFLFVVTLAAFSGCVGIKDQIQGKLSVRVPFQVQSNPRSIYLSNGDLPAAVKLNYGVYGFKSPSATISVQGKEYNFEIPREAISSDDYSIRASAEQLGQSFGIQAKSMVKTLEVWSERRKESCTHCSYCMHLESKTDSKGNFDTSWEFGYSCRCSGREVVIREYQNHARFYDLQFLSSDGDLLGKFLGKGEQYQTSRITETIESCR